MIDVEFFRAGLQELVRNHGGNPAVRLVLHSGAEYLVRDVIQTRQGHVVLNVYHGPAGAAIVASSSSAYECVIPSGFHPVTVAFEAISQVHVFEPSEEQRTKIGFKR